MKCQFCKNCDSGCSCSFCGLEFACVVCGQENCMECATTAIMLEEHYETQYYPYCQICVETEARVEMPSMHIGMHCDQHAELHRARMRNSIQSIR